MKKIGGLFIKDVRMGFNEYKTVVFSGHELVKNIEKIVFLN